MSSSNNKNTRGNFYQYLGLGSGEDTGDGPSSPDKQLQFQDTSNNLGLTQAAERRVFKRFLQGYHPEEIAEEAGISLAKVKALVEAGRKTLREYHSDKMEDLSEESIAIIRMVAQKAWELIEGGASPDKYLTTILKSEELVAKIRGVLTDKVQHTGDITKHIKLYDFRDNFPDIVEGEVVGDRSLELRDIKVSEEDTPFTPAEIPDEEVPRLSEEARAMAERVINATQKQWREDNDAAAARKKRREALSSRIKVIL